MGVMEDFSFRGCMQKSPSQMGLDAAKKLEWLIPNGIGGYSSSTILGMNTRKYHGLLVASKGLLERRVALESLIDEIVAGNDLYSMAVNQYVTTVDQRGLQYLKRFTRAKDHVKFEYDINRTSVVKIIHPVRGVNGLIISYGVRNNFGGTILLRVHPLVNCRGFHEVNLQNRDFKTHDHDSRMLTVDCNGEHMMFFSDEMGATAEGQWWHEMKYAMEEERGEAAIEDAYSPGYLTLAIPPYGKVEAELRIVWGESQAAAATAYEDIRESPYETFEPHPLPILEHAAGSFIADVSGYKTIIAGYHWFSDWGRDTMISLPGICLVNGEVDVAESILARFIDNMRDGMIPTQFTTQGPIYYDFDGTLWMMDRLKEYVKYAGQERAVAFIVPRWTKILSVIEAYSRLVKDGLVRHKGGTWMDTLERSDAVEVQALWYNALNVVEGLSDHVGQHVEYSKLKSDFESAFMDKYWNGNYLNDLLEDDSLRPNQVIAASLEYSPVPVRQAAQLMAVVEQELMTPVGLRTLARNHSDYRPQYVGGIQEREKAYHNGTVWPWLLGPYFDAAVKVGGVKGYKHAMENVKPLLTRMCDNCLGTFNEIYDAEEPHTPRGAVSQAWSVAEILRVCKSKQSRTEHEE